MQVYRGMPIVTQAPSKTITKKLGANLVSFLDPSKEYNAARFREDAQKMISTIQKRDKVPMIVGGTGLYLRALLDGLFETEPGQKSEDQVYRRKLLAAQEKHGGSYLHKKLQKVDPITAGRIHANDLRRIVRALEVHHLTGKPISERMPNRVGLRGTMPHRIYFLDRDRGELYERINLRVDQMFREGLVKEVGKLSKKKLSRTAAMALGLREVRAYLEGTASLAETKELLKRNTRHYAKRQISWFRHEKGIEWIRVEKGETAKALAARIARDYLSQESSAK